MFRLLYSIVLIILVTAYGDVNRQENESISDEDDKEDDVFTMNKHTLQTSLETSGDLRKYYAVEAALQDPKGNMVCSPLSALLPLAKLALGASGDTKHELLAAIGLKKSRQILVSFRKVIKNLKNLPEVTLDIASRFFVNDGVKIKKVYKKKISLVFKSSIENIRMSSPKHAADEINSWVSNQTNGMIQSIISPDDISPDISLVLVNAIYFVGLWASPFKTTKIESFHTPTGVRSIPMMSQLFNLMYYHDEILNAQIVEIPYVGEETSFVLVLPNNKEGLPLLLKQLKLAPVLLNNAIDKMKRVKVELTMPKFKIESFLDLKSLYSKVGIKTIFDENKSALTEITRGNPLKVSHAVQKAIIEVNELGTKAAATSAIGFIQLSSHKVQMVADRPFFFFIKVKGEQLFAGIFNGSSMSTRTRL